MRVLLVEDDECIARSLEIVLAKENYAVDIAIDGELGWQFIESFAYDLILLDVVLPKLDGISLCRQLRESRYQTPVLLLTARNSSVDRIIGLDAGADDYLVKPFELPELLARMRVLLRRGSSPVVPVLEWNQLQIDPTSCQVTYDAQPLHLTPKEYRLLELFLRNPRHVFTRSAILEHLWNLEETPSEDTITAHIKGVRQKLKQVGAPANFIETVYGIGYRLKHSAAHAEVAAGAARLTSDRVEMPDPSGEQTEGQRKQDIQTALQLVWHKYLSRNQAHVQILERFLAKLAIETAAPTVTSPVVSPIASPITSPVTPEEWQQATFAAHKLTGALGLFGRPQGSEIASQLEHFFRAQQSPDPDTLNTLEQQMGQLSAIVCQNPVLSTVPLHQKNILIILDDDVVWMTQIRQLEAELTPMMSLEQVMTYLKTEAAALSDHASLASIFLLNLSLTDLPEQHFSLLSKLTEQIPPLLVLVCTDQASLESRIKWAQAGVYAVLPKRTPPQILTLARSMQSVDGTSTKRILMVDDDAQVLDTLQSLLSPWDFHLTRLEQSQHFWETLQVAMPDLLILDVEMPHYSGIELCRAVRNTLDWHRLPVLFLTAHTDATTLHNALNAGATALLDKSAAQSEIIHQVLIELQRSQFNRISQ